MRVCFLLALWGPRYIEQFSRISLRSLLAPGNIPAISGKHPCDFVFLTNTADIPFFEAQATIRKLHTCCSIKYIDIRDLIFEGNHSATLTAALERGMRSYGDAMLDTYFIYLMADYLFAANALSGLLPHIARGVSAITAGNYQIVEEEVLDEIAALVGDDDTITLSAREMVAWSLRHLHPVTLANIVNKNDTHNREPNRLFWLADRQTLIGRFYLRHTLCLRPERTDYVIGASWDYSFLPEMSPSGNVIHLNDSDDYFVVELQPASHERINIESGPYEPDALASSLRAWTTAEQRANVEHAVVYHGGDLPKNFDDLRAESERFVRSIDARMDPTPAPTNGHFYWLSCIRAVTWPVALEPKRWDKEVRPLLANFWESPTFKAAFDSAGMRIDSFPMFLREDLLFDKAPWDALRRWYAMIFGKAPATHVWHPRFLDYRMLEKALGADATQTILFVLSPRRSQWVEWAGDKHVLRSPLILYRDLDELRLELKDVAACVIRLPETYDHLLGRYVDHLSRALPPGAKIHILFKSATGGAISLTLRDLAVHESILRMKPGVEVISNKTYAGGFRRGLDTSIGGAITRFVRNRNNPIKFIWHGVQLAILHLLYLINNLVGLASGEWRPCTPSTPLCSALVSVEVLATATAEAPPPFSSARSGHDATRAH